jgi:hypothetical protein
MLRKGNEVKWTPEARSSFEQRKQAMTDAPVLISPDYSKEFFIFSFASNDTLVVFLLQKDSNGIEQPISFFNKALRNAKIIYDIMEKQSYALVKSSVTKIAKIKINRDLIQKMIISKKIAEKID